MATLEPPPTYASPVVVDDKTGKSSFNPIWLNWFLSFAQAVDNAIPSDPELAALASVISAADKVPYFTGPGTATVATFTAAGRALVDDIDAPAQRATLGLGSMALQDSTAVAITAGSIGDVTATTSAADTNTTHVATTAFVIGQAGASNPLPEGLSAIVGTSKKYSREDHIHPYNVNCFRATNSGNQTGITSATWTKVTLDTEAFDTKGAFASSRFTANEPGYFQFNGTLYAGGNTSSYYSAALYKNGALYTPGDTIDQTGLAANTAFGLSVSDVIYLNGTTDYVELYGYIVGTAGTLKFSLGASSTLSGFLIAKA